MRKIEVHLRDVVVGTLARDRGGAERFEFDDDYRRLPPSRRPILGQVFEDALPESLESDEPINWFVHLLPQGLMRKWLAGASAISADDSFEMLGVLGGNLPGAVTATPVDDGDAPASPVTAPPSRPRPLGKGLKWSLAGQQYKINARELGGERLTVRGTDDGEPCIIKLDASPYDDVPANEHATMRWAAAAGLPTPPFRLGHIDELDEIPRGLPTGDGQIYVVRRFDRDASSRIHMEDFAQIYDRSPFDLDIYHGSYEQIAETIGYLCPGSLQNFIRQVVFTVCSGNGDAHLKNFSLQYGVGGNVRSSALSPMYDQVSTVVYDDIDSGLALELGGSRDWNIDADRLMSLAAIGHGFADLSMDVVDQAVSDILAAFDPDTLGYPPRHGEIIRAHLDRLPLVDGHR